MHAIKAFLPPLGRLLMSTIFIYEGIVLLRHPAGFTKYFASVHVPAPEAAVWIAIVIQLAGGLAILVGIQGPLGRCCARAVLPGHRVWRAPAGRRYGQHDPFL